jgi:hypothetical protein
MNCLLVKVYLIFVLLSKPMCADQVNWNGVLGRPTVQRKMDAFGRPNSVWKGKLFSMISLNIYIDMENMSPCISQYLTLYYIIIIYMKRNILIFNIFIHLKF